MEEGEYSLNGCNAPSIDRVAIFENVQNESLMVGGVGRLFLNSICTSIRLQTNSGKGEIFT